MQKTPSSTPAPLRALRAFETAARLGGIAPAADELGVTAAAVSRQIKALEVWLGTALFTRRNNAIDLTAAGANLHAEISPAMTTLAAATASVRRSASEVVASVGVTFGVRWLIPLLGDYQKRHPATTLRLSTHDIGLDDADDPDADLQVRYRPGLAPHAGDTPLFTDVSLPLCGPTLHATLVKAGSGAWRAQPIVSATRGDWDWHAWAEATGVDPAELVVAHRLDTDNAAIEATIAGLGIALVTLPLALDALRDGRLHPVPGAPAVAIGHYGLRTRQGAPRASVRAFSTWIREAAHRTAAETGAFLDERLIARMPAASPPQT